jgi:uncharacterized protein YjbI with pentapeptide repeats
MANQEHLDILKQGREAWNAWRQQHPEIQPDLSDVELSRARLIEVDLSNTYFYGADLFSANLYQANLKGTDLSRANLSETTLSYAKLSSAKLYRTRLSHANLFKADLVEANLTYADLSNSMLYGADLSGADLDRAYLSGADLREAHLKEAHLRYANLYGADLSDADFRGADLNHANLMGARIVRTNLTEAIMTDCLVYGASVWKANLQGAKQDNLIVTPTDELTITVGNLKIAQFIYLLLDNEEIRDVIDTITSKVVLILGRFSPERKPILDALREELRQHDLTPVLFDFERPANRDFTETVRTLAHLSLFIIADITEPSSIPQELQTIVPDLEVPVQPVLEEGKKQYAMFPDFSKYSWVFPIYHYKDQAGLVTSLKDEIIEPANKKARELAVEKAKRLERL